MPACRRHAPGPGQRLQGADAREDPFAPIPRGIMCPMIVAGTKVATVRGSWYGKPINLTMSQGGCWLSRWAEVGQIFN